MSTSVGGKMIPKQGLGVFTPCVSNSKGLEAVEHAFNLIGKVGFTSECSFCPRATYRLIVLLSRYLVSMQLARLMLPPAARMTTAAKTKVPPKHGKVCVQMKRRVWWLIFVVNTI